MEGETLWLRAHKEARTCLKRYHDTWTREHRDDLVQEASIAAWRWARNVRHRERFWAAVQTITRRIRGRGLRAKHLVQPEHELVEAAVVDPRVRECHYRIAGQRVPASRVRPWLHEALLRLKEIDRELLMGFYEGFCCAELAERFRRSRACVRTRIHRARVRVQQDVEESVRVAGGHDD
jgi:DNA-directed RNA polymerase specialized sigma24 family protein